MVCADVDQRREARSSDSTQDAVRFRDRPEADRDQIVLERRRRARCRGRDRFSMKNIHSFWTYWIASVASGDSVRPCPSARLHQFDARDRSASRSRARASRRRLPSLRRRTSCTCAVPSTLALLHVVEDAHLQQLARSASRTFRSAWSACRCAPWLRPDRRPPACRCALRGCPSGEPSRSVASSTRFCAAPSCACSCGDARRSPRRSRRSPCR